MSDGDSVRLSLLPFSMKENFNPTSSTFFILKKKVTRTGKVDSIEKLKEEEALKESSRDREKKKKRHAPGGGKISFHWRLTSLTSRHN